MLIEFRYLLLRVDLYLPSFSSMHERPSTCGGGGLYGWVFFVLFINPRQMQVMDKTHEARITSNVIKILFCSLSRKMYFSNQEYDI